MEIFTQHWEWFLLGFMVCEKLVKLSPTDKDDILLDIVWKHGMKKLMIMIGDFAVKQSRGKDDDKIWNDEVKPFIENNF
jgi:hypothetical protein